MKKITKRQIFVWVLALTPLVLIAAAYSRLPDRVPMQWDFGGQVGYEPKWNLWITAGLAPLFAVLLWFMGSQQEGGAAVPTLLMLGPLIAWMMGVTVSADIAYDYTAFHHHVTAGVRGVDDRWGRVLGMATLGVPATVLGAVGSVLYYGMWEHLPAVLGTSLGVLGCVTGLASLLSARLVYPVPKPGESPFATPQGGGMRMMVVQFAAMALSVLRSRSCSSAMSGTAISPALEGVAARTSATKSAMVTSGSWPTAEITGISAS